MIFYIGFLAKRNFEMSQIDIGWSYLSFISADFTGDCIKWHIYIYVLIIIQLFIMYVPQKLVIFFSRGFHLCCCLNRFSDIKFDLGVENL